MDEGIALMELANRAADLFAEQPASEKRRLLEFALSNSFWANGELTPEFRQPFDMLADMATVGAQKMTAKLLTSSHHQKSSPRRSQSEPRVRRARCLCYQEVASRATRYITRVEVRFEQTKARIQTEEAPPRWHGTSTILPVAARLR